MKLLDIHDALPRLAKVFTSLVLIIIIAACKSISVVEPQQERDRGPDHPVDVSHIPEPVPRPELRTIAGNTTPYKVLGKTYHVMQSPEGYREKGIASWYGKKFHGRKTSNGEIYDMYGMTAAHKTLPIPSYVRVTNVDNRRSLILRVNDRGPFHDGRIIDLTYTAAKKLGFARKGTAQVTVEYIDPHSYQAPPTQTAATTASPEPGVRPAPLSGHVAGYGLPDNTFLQLGAFSSPTSAQSLRDKVAKLTPMKVHVISPKRRQDSKLYRVRVGPFDNNLQLLELREVLMKANFPPPHVVNE